MEGFSIGSYQELGGAGRGKFLLSYFKQYNLEDGQYSSIAMAT